MWRTSYWSTRRCGQFFSTGVEVGETPRNIISMNLFKDVASRVKKKKKHSIFDKLVNILEL